MVLDFVQNPPSDGDAHPTDFHWCIPKISAAEKYFLSQLITSPSKDVCGDVTLCLACTGWARI